MIAWDVLAISVGAFAYKRWWPRLRAWWKSLDDGSRPAPGRLRCRQATVRCAREQQHPPRYVVYRIYRRTDGVLIYVGSTGRWGLRMSQREREQWWRPQVGNFTLDDCASREEAFVIEDIAIERERPLYN